VFLAADQSLQNSYSRKAIEELATRSRCVISLAGGAHDGAFIRSRSGSAVFDVDYIRDTDKAAELSKASAQFSQALEAWSELSIDDDELIVVPSHVELTTALTSKRLTAAAKLSVRFNSKDAFDSVEERIVKKIPKKFFKGASWTVSGGVKRPPLPIDDPSSWLWDLVRSTATSLDQRSRSDHRWNSSGVCFVDTDATPAVDGFGAAGSLDADDGQYILSHSLLERSLLLAMLMKDIG
jgi:hypothetical protein